LATWVLVLESSASSFLVSLLLNILFYPIEIKKLL
jgi:hypothetical protein